MCFSAPYGVKNLRACSELLCWYIELYDGAGVNDRKEIRCFSGNRQNNTIFCAVFGKLWDFFYAVHTCTSVELEP